MLDSQQKEAHELNRTGTLQLERPHPKVLALALVIFVALVAGLELLARTEFARSHLVTPGIGSSNNSIDGKLQRLNALVETDGSVECIFLGSSMVTADIDPERVSYAYRQQTGQDITCFNFGINALTASEVGMWGEVLVNKYHPSLLVFGHSARDYAVHSSGDAMGVTEDLPWVRYELGRFAPEGFLIEHSRAYQYYMAYKKWPVPYFHDLLQGKQDIEERLTPYGFEPYTGLEDVSKPPDLESGMAPDFAEQMAGYELGALDVAGLQRLIDLREAGVQVVLVELPIPDTYYAFLENGRADYEIFLDGIGSIAEAESVPFFRTETLGRIPEDCCWYDHAHLNDKGAAIYSQWLGQQLGAAVQDGTLQPIDSDTPGLYVVP